MTKSGFTLIDVDLNLNAGGEYVYLFYAKDAGSSIGHVAITIGEGSSVTGYTAISTDLNLNAGGEEVYLHYKGNDSNPIRDVTVTTTTTPYVDGSGRTFAVIETDLNERAGGTTLYLQYLDYYGKLGIVWEK